MFPPNAPPADDTNEKTPEAARGFETTFTYRLTSASDGIVARCIEAPVEAMGATEKGALAALERALVEYMTTTEAVAPPSIPPPVAIRLVAEKKRETSEACEPQGPGDSPAAERIGS